MARATPTVRGDSLSFYKEGQAISVIVGSTSWFEWLNEETSTTFSLQSSHGAYTARKERIGNSRGGWYWKAYRKHQGNLHRAYLGKAEDLTVARLEEIAAMLSERIYGEAAPARELANIKPPAKRRGNDDTMPLLLETKLHPPQLPALLVERTRLFARLDNSLIHKLTLLQAPAGFGKTTLVNQWLAARHSSVARAWVSLDAGDNEPLAFWRYVMRACQISFGKETRPINKGLALLSPTNRPLFEQPPIEMALTLLLNEIAELAKEGLLVLDDYHVISEPRIHETLGFFIDHLPQTVHILLLSRSEPALPLLRWRARGALYDLHVSDLRFSLEEEKAFLHQTLPVSFSDEALIQLDSTLEGWAAGLRLLSLALSGWKTAHAIEQAFLSLGERTAVLSASEGFSIPHRSLLDYFALEILETQPEPLQHFLLRTSLLNRLSAPLCAAVTGQDDSAARLEEIERAGLFLEALEGPGGWYRYHTLFAEAMSREASRRLGEEVVRDIARQASSWYEQEELFTEAIEMAWLARDMERLARLIEIVNEIDFYEPRSILRWLEDMPEEVLHRHPTLCFLFATELCFPEEYRFAQKAIPATELIPLSEERRARVEMLLQIAEEGWRKAGDWSWIGALWSHRVLSCLINLEPYPLMVGYAQRALDFLPQGEERDRRLRMYRSTSRLMVGIEKLRLGHVIEAQQLLTQAQEDNVPPGNRFLATDIHLTLGKCHYIRGEFQQAREYLNQALTDASELNDDEIVADTLLELAWIAFEKNDLAGAEHQAREALEAARRANLQTSVLYDRITLQLVLLSYARGEDSGVLEQLAELLAKPEPEWTPNSFWLLSRVRAWHTRLRVATGDTRLAEDSVSIAPLREEETTITEYLEEQVRRARLLLAQGNAKVVLEQLTDILPYAQEQLHRYTALEIQLLLALAHAECKQDQQAFYWLRQTLEQAMSEGYIRLFLNEGITLTRLLRSSLPTIEDKTLRAYAQTILSAETQVYKQQEDSVASMPASSLIEPLSPQEQRVLRLLVAGWSNQDIARELIVSVNTVKYHIKHLYQKLGVNNRLQASEAARHLKLEDSL